MFRRRPTTVTSKSDNNCATNASTKANTFVMISLTAGICSNSLVSSLSAFASGRNRVRDLTLLGGAFCTSMRIRRPSMSNSKSESTVDKTSTINSKQLM